MQMIADGKIKDGTVINRIDEYCEAYKYEYKNGNLYFNGRENITKMFQLKNIINLDFEILEDKTEEIEELHLEKDYIINNSIDREIQNKINELVKAVNKLNKQDTSKETNCMTD